MDSLTKCLFDFTKDRRIGGLYNDPEYEEIARSVEMQIKKVQNGMAEEQRWELVLLLTSLSALCSIEEEHIFQAALALGRDLRALA